MRLIRCPSARAATLALAVALAMPLAGGAPTDTGRRQGGARQLRRPGGKTAAGGGQHLVHPGGAGARRHPAGPEIPLFPPGSPFEQFFKDFLNRNRPGGRGGEAQPPPPDAAHAEPGVRLHHRCRPAWW